MLKHFLRIDKGVDILIRWFGVLGVLSAGLAFGAKRATWLADANWADAILIGVGLALLTMLGVTASLALFRVFRPLPDGKHTATRVPDGEDLVWRENAERSMIAAGSELARFEGHIDQAVTDISDEMARLKSVFGTMVDHWDKISKIVPTLEASVANMKVEIDEMGARAIYTYDRSMNEIGELREANKAILHREKMRELATLIEANAGKLREYVANGKQFDAALWDEWQRHYQVWWSRVYDWCQWALPYMPKAYAHIESIDHGKISGTWAIRDEQFPSSNEVHQFKIFCLRHENWKKCPGGGGARGV